MIIFRPHKGSLDEAMKHAKEFETEELMKEHIVSLWNGWIDFDDISIGSESVNDDRNGWKDTRYVLTKRFGNEQYFIPQCVGMCATDYSNL